MPGTLPGTLLAALDDMPLSLDENFVRDLGDREPLSVADARAIDRLAYLMVEIDFDEYPEERASMERLVASVWRIAGHEREELPPVSPLPIDDEERRMWIQRLAGELETSTGRELAFVVGYLVVTSDHQLGRTEGRTLDLLQRVLGIDDARATQLAAMGAGAITPDVGDKPDVAANRS